MNEKGLSQGNVLILSENRTGPEMLEKQMSLGNYRVLRASELDEAAETVRKDQVDLVLAEKGFLLRSPVAPSHWLRSSTS